MEKTVNSLQLITLKRDRGRHAPSNDPFIKKAMDANQTLKFAPDQDRNRQQSVSVYLYMKDNSVQLKQVPRTTTTAFQEGVAQQLRKGQKQ